ncbi:MAG: hypothetical protein FWF51_09200 [Chitinivibrionia bacterium]|nr:hypothetical protein [Chitinivibrionia bacterium]
MPILQVTDFPADIYNKISAQAVREKISFEQKVIMLLKNGLPPQTLENKARRKAVFDRIKEMNVSSKTQKIDSVKIIREMREEREREIYDGCS